MGSRKQVIYPGLHNGEVVKPGFGLAESSSGYRSQKEKRREEGQEIGAIEQPLPLHQQGGCEKNTGFGGPQIWLQIIAVSSLIGESEETL